MKKAIAVLHFSPIEYYPPIINLLNSIDSSENAIIVYTTSNTKGLIEYKRNGVKIHRISITNKNSTLINYFNLFYYNLVVSLMLIFNRPGSLLYYETTSSFPAWVSMMIYGKRIKVLVHCHEYFTKDWYTIHANLTVRFFHYLEKKFIYPSAVWISHTNMDRVQRFLNDHPNIDGSKLKIVPNYPPKSWQLTGSSKSQDGIVKVVYVGALSFYATYIKEFCEWVISKNGSVLFDIYSYNARPDTKQYLKSINSKNIRFFDEGINYESIPETLIKYDVGAILYKGTTPNSKYCAPNKLFEYLICGLDVWFPEEMVGCYDFIQNDIHPFVLKLDFKKLDELEVIKATYKDGMAYRPFEFNCETALIPLIHEMQ